MTAHLTKPAVLFLLRIYNLETNIKGSIAGERLRRRLRGLQRKMTGADWLRQQFSGGKRNMWNLGEKLRLLEKRARERERMEEEERQEQLRALREGPRVPQPEPKVAEPTPPVQEVVEPDLPPRQLREAPRMEIHVPMPEAPAPRVEVNMPMPEVPEPREVQAHMPSSMSSGRRLPPPPMQQPPPPSAPSGCPCPEFSIGPRTGRAMPRRALRHRAVVVTVFALGAVAFCGAPRGDSAAPRRSGRTAVGAEPDLASEAWKEMESVSAVVAGIEGSSEEDAQEWLQAGFAWTQKSRRFWRKLRREEEPQLEAVQDTAEYHDEPIPPQDWVKKFPEVLGLAAEELSSGQKTAPSYLKSEVAYNKAIRSNPQLLGKNYDCLAEHEACHQGSEV
eukprot:s158_g7.t1